MKRIQLKHWRWVLLVSYLLITATIYLYVFNNDLPDWSMLFLSYFGVGFHDNMIVIGVVLPIFIATQLIFLTGVGTENLCRPIHRRRLLLPVIIGAFMMGMLTWGLMNAFTELFALSLSIMSIKGLLFIFAVSWIGWGIFFLISSTDVERFAAIRKIQTTILAGSLLQLLIVIPSHLLVTRRPGCFAGMLTMLGISSGVSVMFWSFGPGIILLFLAEKRDAERRRMASIGKITATDNADSAPQ